MIALALLSLVALIECVANVPVKQADVTVLKPYGGFVTIKSVKKISAPGEFCPTCVSFVDDMLDILLNILLNQGIQGSCAEYCGYLPLQVEAQVCQFLCDIVGIEAFIKLLTDADPDPIWICEELTICPISDSAKGNVTVLNVLPKSAAQGATFNIDLVFQIVKAIGTGQLVISINPPNGDGSQMGDGILLVATPPGSYSAQLQIDTSMTSKNEPFGPGRFGVVVDLCEGSCGSIHSHSYLLSQKVANFTIT